MKKNEISSLYRSFSPRMVQYESDGKGRDTYINYNNGGFWGLGAKIHQGRDEHIKVSGGRYHYKFLPKHVAPFKYNSDGTGRDSYVISESGGLKRNYKPLQEFHLKDFLRTADDCVFKLRKHSTNDGRSVRTHYVSKQEILVNNHLKTIQNNLIDRLYIKEKHKFIKK